MLEKNNVHIEQDPSKVSSLPPKVNTGRRRFNAAGVAASGVLMTVASRSALATGACNAAGPSGVGSVHTSARPANYTPLACGLSPGYWAQHDQSDWPMPMATNYKGELGSGPNLSFFTVVSTTGNDDNSQLHRHIAAEWLSMLKYPSINKYLSFAQLKLMAAGTFPSGGAPWSSTKVIAYLTQIQG